MRNHRLVTSMAETLHPQRLELTLFYEKKPKLGRGQRRNKRNRAGQLVHRRITEPMHRSMASTYAKDGTVVIARVSQSAYKAYGAYVEAG